MRALNGYFRQLKSRLDCPRADRARFLAQARDMAREFLDEQPDATPDMIEANLGTPEELAHYFLETLEPDRLKQYHTRKKWLRRIRTALVVALILFLTFAVIRFQFRPMHVEVIDTITIYEYRTEGEPLR